MTALRSSPLSGILLLSCAQAFAGGSAAAEASGPRTRVTALSLPSFRLAAQAPSSRLDVNKGFNFDGTIPGFTRSLVSPQSRQGERSGRISMDLPASVIPEAGRGFWMTSPADNVFSRDARAGLPNVAPDYLPPLEREALALAAKSEALAKPLEDVSELSRETEESAWLLGRRVWDVMMGAAQGESGATVLVRSDFGSSFYGREAAMKIDDPAEASGSAAPKKTAALDLPRARGIAIAGAEGELARSADEGALRASARPRVFPGRAARAPGERKVSPGVPLIAMEVFQKSLVLSLRSSTGFLIVAPIPETQIAPGSWRVVRAQAAAASALGSDSLAGLGAIQGADELAAFHEAFGAAPGVNALPKDAEDGWPNTAAYKSEPKPGRASEFLSGSTRGFLLLFSLALLSCMGASLALREFRF